MIIDVRIESWSPSPVVRPVPNRYQRISARQFRDFAAGLTPRQAVFYRNFIRMAEALQSPEIPVDFELPAGDRLFLDRGCIKIAEHAGFIQTLADDASGTVGTVRLAWRVEAISNEFTDAP